MSRDLRKQPRVGREVRDHRIDFGRAGTGNHLTSMNGVARGRCRHGNAHDNVPAPYAETFRPAGHAHQFRRPIGPSVWTTSVWSGTSTSPTGAWPGSPDLTLTVRRDRITAVTLDAVDLEVASVTMDGRPAPFTHDGERLRIDLPGPQAEGTTVVVAVRYACRPRRGLYFVGPDAEHPDRPPNAGRRDRTTTPAITGPASTSRSRSSPPRCICTAPAGTFVLSNGVLARAGPRCRRRAARPLALLASTSPTRLPRHPGGRSVRRARGPGRATGVDVYYYVAPGREERRPSHLRAHARR